MSEKSCILVVDDDEGVRKSLTLILKRKGYLVESAATGKEALAIAQGRSVSLTLLDLKLPDIMGTQLLAPLKQTNPDMSIIMITGFASVENAVQSLTAGASGYITKPIDLDGMLARIKTALDHQHLVTEVRRAEDALRESEEKFRGIFDTINDGIQINEFEPGGKPGKFIEVNEIACRMLQYTREELLGLGHLDIVSMYHGRPFDDIIGELSTTGHAIFETGHRRKDGIIVPVEINAHVVNLQGKRMTVSVIRDITERKVAEDALALASKKLTLLSGITRHDINNQLTVLQGYLTILQKKQPDPSFTEYFLKVSTAAQRISSMIQFTKEYEAIGVNAPVWQNALTLVNTAAKQAPLGKIMVKNDLPAGMEVFADPLIVKVFYNLMDNAVRYGGKITTIQFAVEEPGDEHLIVCEDDGDGVVAGEKEKIFERGFGKNTGLGLALAREILDITGITIRETGEPGKGARFEMTVPKGMWRIAEKITE